MKQKGSKNKKSNANKLCGRINTKFPKTKKKKPGTPPHLQRNMGFRFITGNKILSVTRDNSINSNEQTQTERTR